MRKPLALICCTGTLGIACIIGSAILNNAACKAEITENNQAWEQKLSDAEDDIKHLENVVIEQNRKIANRTDADSENHGNWIDCRNSLIFINTHLDEIDSIDNSNPVPIIYMKDGRVMMANDSHQITELKIE